MFDLRVGLATVFGKTELANRCEGRFQPAAYTRFPLLHVVILAREHVAEALEYCVVVLEAVGRSAADRLISSKNFAFDVAMWSFEALGRYLTRDFRHSTPR